MPIKFRTIVTAIAISLIASIARGENNIVHLWADSTLTNTVAVASRSNYVFIADRDLGMVAMAVYDTIPPQFASLYDPGVPLFDIEVHGTYAYIASGINDPHTGWLLILDIESPANPIFVGSLQSNLEYRRVAVGAYAYGLQTNTLKTININNPANPVEIGSVTVTNAIDLCTRGNYVYVACQNYGLRIIDITIPESPQVVGTCDTPGIASGISMRIADSSHVYIADGGAGIQIIDVSTPSEPIIVGNYQTAADAMSITGGKNYIYTTLSDSNVAVVMVGNPRYLKLVGSTDIPHLPSGIALYGANAVQGIVVTDRIMLDTYAIHRTPCVLHPGDMNNSGNVNGVDVSFGVIYFKGGPAPPYICSCWSHPNFAIDCDVNASCQFNGVDITYLVAFLKGSVPELLSCPDCPYEY